MDKHEFSKVISEGLKKRKIEKQKQNDRIFVGYASDRSKKVEKEHNRLKKS
jgi:hypothetical protein